MAKYCNGFILVAGTCGCFPALLWYF